MTWLTDRRDDEEQVEIADLRYKLEAAVEALEYLRDMVTDEDILEVVQDALDLVRD